MDRRQAVKPRGRSIQLDFYYLGIRCRESLKLEPTKANLLFAHNKYAAIQHEIAVGIFQYSKHFPDSKNAHLGAKSSHKTVSIALDDYLQATKRTLEASTWRGYRSVVEYHLKPTFGHLRMVDMTSVEIKKWISTLNVTNKRTTIFLYL